MTTRQVPSEDEVREYMTSLSNWGRWGPEDEMGTLNLITPEKRAKAGSLVREGITVSCSEPIDPDAPGEEFFGRPQHFMTSTGESAPGSGPGEAGDYIAMPIHGAATHVDCPSHLFWDGKMYNGKPASLVTAKKRASAGSINSMEGGVVTRGILLDIAGLKGKNWMDLGEAIFPEDLEAAEAAQGVQVEEGDALLVRTGWAKRRRDLGPPTERGCPGLHVACHPWYRKRGISIIVSDVHKDVEPSGYREEFEPVVHRIGLVSMGLWDLDAAIFEDLVAVCKRLNRWEFMFVVAPIRLHNATGCPVNPLAIF